MYFFFFFFFLNLTSIFFFFFFFFTHFKKTVLYNWIMDWWWWRTENSDVYQWIFAQSTELNSWWVKLKAHTYTHTHTQTHTVEGQEGVCVRVCVVGGSAWRWSLTCFPLTRLRALRLMSMFSECFQVDVRETLGRFELFLRRPSYARWSLCLYTAAGVYCRGPTSASLHTYALLYFLTVQMNFTVIFSLRQWKQD